MKIDLSRYSEDVSCYEPEGLRKKLMVDLMPTMARIKLQRNRCIVATYVPPSVTKGGIILVNNTVEENRYQGKSGLLIAAAPSAFDFDELREEIARRRKGKTSLATATRDARAYLGIPQVGDWVSFINSETREFGVPVAGEHTLASCRIVTDDCIGMVIDDPRLIY